MTTEFDAGLAALPIIHEILEALGGDKRALFFKSLKLPCGGSVRKWLTYEEMNKRYTDNLRTLCELEKAVDMASSRHLRLVEIKAAVQETVEFFEKHRSEETIRFMNSLGED